MLTVILDIVDGRDLVSNRLRSYLGQIEMERRSYGVIIVYVGVAVCDITATLIGILAFIKCITRNCR